MGANTPPDSLNPLKKQANHRKHMHGRSRDARTDPVCQVWVED